MVRDWEIVRVLWFAVSMACVILVALRTKGWIAPTFVAIVALGVGWTLGLIA